MKLFIKKIFFSIIPILILPQLSEAFLGTAEAKIIVNVSTETGDPLDDATVRIGMKDGHVKKDAYIGKTNNDGFFETSGRSASDISIGVDKIGYYHSSQHHDFFNKKFNHWLPWPKEISVVMRPIVNPVPMYVRNAFFEFPIVGEDVGFDLMKGDWVVPYGQGTHSDFIFKVERQWDDVDNNDSTMTLTFSNQFDGIQLIEDDEGGIFNTGSQFRLPRTAPESGYQPKIQKRVSSGKYGRRNEKSRDNCYIFRVRSEVDETGRLKRAMYGKIRRELRFSPGSISIGLYYYLNPDYTRNLEFDPKSNLSIVSEFERVEQP